MIGNGLRLFSRVLDFFAVVSASAVRTCRRYSAPIVQNRYLNISSHEQGTGALLNGGSAIEGLLSKLTPLFVLLKEPAFLHSTHPRLILAERAIFEKIGYRREFLKATVSGAEPELGRNRKVTLKL